MLKYGMWDLPDLDYFQAKNTFKGSKGKLRFLIKPDETIKVLSWVGDICFELAENIKEKEFEFSEQSLYDINNYLSSEYDEVRNSK